MHADVKRMTGIAEFIQRHRGGRAPLPRKRPGVVREGKLTKCLTIGAGALLTKMMMDPMMMMMNNKHEMTDAEKYPNMTKQEIEILKKNEGKKSDGNYDYIISEQNSSNYYQSSSADNAPLKISTNIGPELYNLQMKMPYSKKDHDILKMIHDILDDPKTPDEQKLQMEKQAAGIMTRPSTGSVSLCVYVPDNNKAQMAQMVAMMGKDIDGETDMSAMMMSGAGDMNQMMMMRAMNGGANGGVDYLKMLGITKVGLIKKAPTRSYNSQPNKDEQPPTIITDLKDPRVGCISVGRIFEMFGISKYVQKENSHVQHFEGRTGYKTLRDGRRLYDYWRLPPSLWRGMGTMFSGGQPGFEIAPNFILSMGMTAKIRAQVIWDATAAQTGFNLNMWRSVGAGTAGAEHIAVQMRFVSRSDRAARESLTAVIVIYVI